MSDPVWVSQYRLHRDFGKHGPKFPFSTVDEYVSSSLDTFRVGVRFEFEDRKGGRDRIGYYDKAGNRLTVVTDDGLYILSHYRPTQGEAYIRRLKRSTYT